MPSHAVVAGATGLVGRALVDRLAASDAFDSVTILVRRHVNRALPGVREVITDFDRLDDIVDQLPKTDIVAFSALGTTIRKAGSRDVFRHVDHDFVVAFAELCLGRGGDAFHVVSSLGADPASHVFYNRVKGEMERDVETVGFGTVRFYRPSILTGHRDESRPGETAGIFVARIVDPLLRGPLAKYRGIPADTVARAMVNEAAAGGTGVRVIEGDEIRALANGA